MRNLHKINNFTDTNEVPYAVHRVRADDLHVNGSNTPLTPGSKLEYEMPDMYGRPWSKIWAESFEQNMSGPADTSEDMFNFEN